VEVRNVLVEFTVDEQGRPTAIKVLDDSGDAKRADRTVTSIRTTARYRPRFENGEAVATPGVQLSQPWILLLPPPAATPVAPAPAPATAPVDKPAT
jgi:TonB family protein